MATLCREGCPDEHMAICVDATEYRNVRRDRKNGTEYLIVGTAHADEVEATRLMCTLHGDQEWPDLQEEWE